MMFEVGDVVRRIEESKWPDEFGEVGKEYVVFDVNHNNNIQIFTGGNYAEWTSFVFVRKSQTQLSLTF